MSWGTMRDEHLLTYPECRVCESSYEQRVVHVRYRGEKGVSERPGDLVTLCVTHFDNLRLGLPYWWDSPDAALDFIHDMRLDMLAEMERLQPTGSAL